MCRTPLCASNNTNNLNKTLALLQTTVCKDESNIVFMRKSQVCKIFFDKYHSVQHLMMSFFRTFCYGIHYIWFSCTKHNNLSLLTLPVTWNIAMSYFIILSPSLPLHILMTISSVSAGWNISHLSPTGILTLINHNLVCLQCYS